MKRTLIASAGLALLAVAGMARATSWTTIVAPGEYGRVPVGGYTQPPQVYSDQPILAIAQAVLAARGYPQVGDVAQAGIYPPVSQLPQYSAPTPQYQQQAPVYLWVPEYHRTHWAQSCNSYGACNVPVYFVQDRWYQDNVMRRNWSAQQRSWNQAQWMEQDRVARERWEQARWAREQAWHQQQEQQLAAQRAQQQARWNQERYEHDRQEHERLERVRWEQAHGRGIQPVPAWQPPAPRPIPVISPRPEQNGGQGDRWHHDHDHDHDRDRGHDHDHDHDHDRDHDIYRH